MSETCAIVRDMTKHIPPAGESLIAGGHTMSASCPCNPTKKPTAFTQSASGRGGRHQGYKRQEETYVHHHMEVAQ